MSQELVVTYRPERYADNQRTYVVLGAPRGGTSMLAGTLQLLGIPMGAAGFQHEDPAFHDVTNIRGMIGTIRERDAVHRLWGWKLPNTVHYYHRLARHVRNPVFMVIYRNPFDVFMSASGKAESGLTEGHFNAPAYHYGHMHDLIRKQARVPVHAMSYERACAAPREFVDALAAVLPLDVDEASRTRATEFINVGRGYSDLGQPGDGA